MQNTYLAIDFGGGSGRVIAARISEEKNGKTLCMEEIHRFPNYTVRIGDYLYWDFPYLFNEMKKGLSIAASRYDNVVSVGIDTWGVDFGLVDSDGNLIGNPIAYRDPHTLGLPEKFMAENNPLRHYSEIGIQILPINTLFRLWSMAKNRDPRLKIASHLLFMPDLFGYYLTGKTGNEYTIASTSELLKARNKDWDKNLIESIGIDPKIFGKILMPGSIRGKLLKDIAEETGLPENVNVVSVGSHDTASAVFAESDDYSKSGTVFLSSGTWSLLGVVLEEPILDEKAYAADYTNEGGVEGKITFLTNITGLWILQRLKAQWDNEGLGLDWSELTDEAEKAGDVDVINVDDPLFQDPDNMKGRIQQYCKDNGLRVPGTPGEFMKCVCLSLATRYKKAIDDLNKILPQPARQLKIFGGGAKNRLLNTMTSEITGLEVITGNAEATAIGNILVQAIASGEIKDRSEIKEYK